MRKPKGGVAVADELSRVVALAWGVEAAPQRGPKRELSLERIVEAAMEIADAEGLQAVTMQRVAQVFGYTTMAMYRYVATKDDLHSLMVDAAARQPIVVDDEDWRVGIDQWCRALAEMYRRHPWVLDIPASAEALLMPGHVQTADAALRAMRALPATLEDRLMVLMTLSTIVRAQADFARELAREGAVASEATRELIREVVTVARFPDLGHLVASGAYFGGAGDLEPGLSITDEDLTMSLDLVYAGIAATYGEASAPVVPTPEPETPRARWDAAERELESVTALRKATQRRVRELEKREAAVRKARDAAKAAAKAQQ